MSNDKTTKARCKGQTADGQQCGMKPTASGYCFNHDPVRSADRAEARKRGGEARHSPHAGDLGQIVPRPRNIPDVLTILDYSLAETLALDNGIQRGRLLVSIGAAYVDALKVGELETQLKELLRVLELRKE
jgi:hypothetical protein